MRWAVARQLRVLDFDLENRPLSYMGMDFTSAEITAVAWSWVGTDEVSCILLTNTGKYVTDDGRKLTPAKALGLFLDAYNEADAVTGHYIRKHDLPLLNGALLELGLPPLPPKMTCDTKMDMVRKKDLSASQESLSEMYGLPEPKYHMTQGRWRAANRLQPDGLEEARERVVSDVVQHKALRAAMIQRHHLRPGRVWYP